MTDFSTYDLTIPAGESRVLPGGGYFRVHEADGVLLVTFKSDTGNNLASGLFEEGEWARFTFGQVVVKNDTATATTCKLRVSKLESGSDQMTGAITVTGSLIDPVPVEAGVPISEIGSANGERTIQAGNLSAIFFPPTAAGYFIDKITVVTDVIMAIGVFGATEAAILAEATWSGIGAETMQAAPFGSIGIQGYRLDDVAAGVSAIADAAVAIPGAARQLGTLQPGRHVLDIDFGVYVPAGSAGMGFGVVFKPLGPVPCSFAPNVAGLRVI